MASAHTIHNLILQISGPDGAVDHPVLSLFLAQLALNFVALSSVEDVIQKNVQYIAQMKMKHKDMVDQFSDFCEMSM